MSKCAVVVLAQRAARPADLPPGGCCLLASLSPSSPVQVQLFDALVALVLDYCVEVWGPPFCGIVGPQLGA